jgi:hypothetical protein
MDHFSLLLNLDSTKFITLNLRASITPSILVHIKVKGLPQQAEVAQGVPRRLRPRIFLTFGITPVVRRQPYAPAAFISGESPGAHF